MTLIRPLGPLGNNLFKGLRNIIDERFFAATLRHRSATLFSSELPNYQNISSRYFKIFENTRKRTIITSQETCQNIWNKLQFKAHTFGPIV